MSKKAVIFGAGSIGRGFISELMYLSHFDIIFVDVNQKLMDELNNQKYYTLELLSNNKKTVKILPVKNIVCGNDYEKVAILVAEADLIFTAVGQNSLKYIAKPIALGVEKRGIPINILLCENMMDAHIEFCDMVKEHLMCKDNINKVGFIRTSVGRMVPLTEPESDIMTVKAEPYYKLPVDADFIKGDLPKFFGLELISPFDYAIERKLFIHNLGHVACSWLGAKKNLTYIYEAIEDIEIKQQAIEAMKEAATALCVKYTKDISEIIEHINDLVSRFGNRELKDTISRVGRDTRRKLSPENRVVGAFKLCESFNLPNRSIKEVIFAGLEFKNDDEGTNYVQNQVSMYGKEKVLNSLINL